MTKKTFLAQQWLQRESDPTGDPEHERPSLKRPSAEPVKNRFRSFIYPHRAVKPKIESSDQFSPLHCFIPGWKGESLPSKNVIRFERLLSLVQQDIKNQLFKTKDFPRTIKFGLHNEFLSYAESQGLNFEGLDDLASFWQMIDPEKLEKNHGLAQFIEIYSYRVATITFYKLRFIASLIQTCGLELSDKALLYPTSFLSQIFKKGSLLELKSRALESNLYSWYHPHEKLKDSIKELLLISRDLSITEIIKNVSNRTQVSQDQQKVYSHAISHLSFGLFLNSLQINYPIWLETTEGKSTNICIPDQEQIISCKYFGDYLESLSLSHWLAQENNKDFRWDEFLCPDFKGKEFISGTFIKICNELQFLTFLANKAENQGEKTIEYICRIIGGHFRNRKNAPEKHALSLEDNPFYTSTYDRVILNLCHFPKNNQQHFLMTQILDQVKFLKPHGYLFVLSSKKLFVPSLRERLEPVLKELKTEAIFDLENVKGKGELGSFVYIFRKKNKGDQDKQLCSYFRISAELESFHEFAAITEYLRTFYLSNLTEVPAMAHLEFPDTFRIEFFQEAIVNGMLIHSTNEDSSRITHPAYFKGLLDSCVPLDTLFEIKVLSADNKPYHENSLNLGFKQDLSYFLVVDFRRPEVNLELHPTDTFRSIYADYGETLCSYFQLIPKLAGLNPNLLRNFFLTPVGRQVANLTFSGGHNLVKGSLSKFLLPKFLAQNEFMPEHLQKTFRLLEMTEATLLETSPQDVMTSFNHVDHIAKSLFPRYACEILSRLSSLESNLESLISKFNDARYGQKISFSNPLIQNQLVQKAARAIYPENEDIYLEFVPGARASDIHLPLTSTQLNVNHEGDLKLYSLELMSGNQIIVRLHAEEMMVLFIQFILSHANNVPINKILKAVHVPKLEDLKAIIENTRNFKGTYEEILKRVKAAITEAFRMQVATRRSP